MADPSHDAPTEAIPTAGVTPTQSLPVVGPTTEPQAAAPTRPAPRPAAAPAPAAASPAAPAPAPRRRGRLLAGAVALVVVGLGVGAGVGLVTRGESAAPSPSSTAPATDGSPVEASFASVDPSGGSGLQERDGGWRTQTYRTATFGNLKPGVGLLADLGGPAAVGSVSFDAGPGPITVQLLAGDSAGTSADDFTAVGEPMTVEGASELSGTDGGEHRYWMVWVTELAPADGGFSATLDDVTVTG